MVAFLYIKSVWATLYINDYNNVRKPFYLFACAFACKSFLENLELNLCPPISSHPELSGKNAILKMMFIYCSCFILAQFVRTLCLKLSHLH